MRRFQMKMMNINGQHDSPIESDTPSKKTKMKQARLPFQMGSSVDSPNVKLSKKRKLTSPAMETRSPKSVKIQKKNSNNKGVKRRKSCDSGSDTTNKNYDRVEIIESAETENVNVKENALSNQVESKTMIDTPKRTSTTRRKSERLGKSKSSPLIKFFQKTEKPGVENSKEFSPSSVEQQKDESDMEDSDAKSDTKLPELKGNISDMAGNSSSVLNDSLCQSDSDVVISSDNEDRDEDTKSTSNTDKSVADSAHILRTPKSDPLMPKKLTPKQQEKKLLSARKKDERQRMKMEKEKKLEEERRNRRKEKEEKRKEKEGKERAEKEQRMVEKKMKEQKKLMEIEQKQKEKQAKEEERRKREEAKEEERKKKEEEKLEAERKKQKAASNFTSFFVAKKQEKSVDEESTTEVKNFMPFEVKADMKVAPVCRRTLNEQEKSSLDEKYNEGITQLSNLYINELKEKRYVPRKSFQTWPFEAKDDVILLDDDNDDNSNMVNQSIVIEKQRAKLLQFSENQRPPYWGTWRKRSSHVNPRRPFSRDTKWFNYEVDSEEEWEEEEPGESLRGSDDEKDEENPEDNEYDVDNEFMVPHGYLSDEELRADEEDKEGMTPETQKYKLKVMGEQFESERNTKTSKLKPKIIGCIWRGSENEFASNVPRRTIDFLSLREAWVRQIPVVLPTVSENDAMATSECCTPTRLQASANSKKARLPEEALPDLIRLIHGNVNGRRFLVKEFMIYWSKKDEKGEKRISKGSLLQKIREIGSWRRCPEEGAMHKKACWYIPEETRKKFVDEELSLPNKWAYNLTPTKKVDFTEAAEKSEREDKEKEKKNVPLITQFTKKITQEEMKRQLTVKPVQTTPKSTKTGPTKAPKRATLISVGRGEQFSKTSKEKMLKVPVATEDTENKQSKDDSDDDVIILDSGMEEEEFSIETELDVKSAGEKGTGVRLGGVKFEEEAKGQGNESANVGGRKNDGKMQSNCSTKNDVSSKDANGTVVTLMDIDD